MSACLTRLCLFIAVLASACQSDVQRGPGVPGNTFAGANGPSAPLETTVQQSLQAALDRARAGEQAIGAGMAVWLADGRGWAGVSGTATPQGRAITLADQHPIGSITKTFTAVVILQLVQDGKLRLDDPVSRYVQAGGAAAQVTVRQLLQHQSGIPEYLADARDITSPVIPEQLVNPQLAKPLLFQPGAGWNYSNTNYILLGMIAERVGGMTFAQQVRARILLPLGLVHTYFDGFETAPQPSLRGVVRDNGTYIAEPREHASWAWSAGAIVSNLNDQLMFARALLDGRLLSAPMMAEMRRFVPDGSGGQYGLGVMLDSAGGAQHIGHGGLIDAVYSYSTHFPETGLTMTVFCITAPCRDDNILNAGVSALRGAGLR